MGSSWSCTGDPAAMRPASIDRRRRRVLAVATGSRGSRRTVKHGNRPDAVDRTASLAWRWVRPRACLQLGQVRRRRRPSPPAVAPTPGPPAAIAAAAPPDDRLASAWQRARAGWGWGLGPAQTMAMALPPFERQDDLDVDRCAGHGALGRAWLWPRPTSGGFPTRGARASPRESQPGAAELDFADPSAKSQPSGASGGGAKP